MQEDLEQVSNERQDLIADVALVSSGTIASLTGLRLYDDLYYVRQSWIIYTAEHYNPAWRNWRDAWAAYAESGWFTQKGETP